MPNFTTQKLSFCSGIGVQWTLSTVLLCYKTIPGVISSAKSQLIQFQLGKDNRNTRRGLFLQKPPVKLTKTSIKVSTVLVPFMIIHPVQSFGFRQGWVGVWLRLKSLKKCLIARKYGFMSYSLGHINIFLSNNLLSSKKKQHLFVC